MKNNQKIAILAKLFDFKGDLTKQWYVYFTIRNASTGKMERQKVYKGLNQSTKAARYRAGERIISEVNAKILSGWTPWDDPTVIYADSLKYHNFAQNYKLKRGSNRTWNYVHAQYINEIKGIARIGTWQTYQSKFRMFDIWLHREGLADNDIAAFSQEDAKRFILYLKNERKLTGFGLNAYAQLFRKVNKQLISEGKIKEDPFLNIPHYKHTPRHPSLFTDEIISEVKDLSQEVDQQLWIIIRFIFYCAIRPKELRFLKIRDIDWQKGVATVPSDISKNHKAIPVVIPQHFLDELKEKEYHKFPGEYYLFSIEKLPGINHVSKNYMAYHFNNIRKKLGIPKEIKFYSWKHTGGVKLKKAGVDIVDIKNQFRHHSLDELYNYLCRLEGTVSEKIKFNGPRI